MLASQSRAL